MTKMIVLLLLLSQSAGGASSSLGTNRQAVQDSVRGYLILNAISAARFQLAPRDSLDEVSARDVPARVFASAKAVARREHYSPRCTRFFAAPRGVFVLVLRAGCTEGIETEDGAAVTAIGSEGNLVGPVLSLMGGPVVEALVPAERRFPPGGRPRH